MTTEENLDAFLLSPADVRDPYQVYDLLRESQPAYWSERWQAWLLTRYGWNLLLTGGPRSSRGAGPEGGEMGVASFGRRLRFG